MRKIVLMVALFMVGVLVGIGATSVFAQGAAGPSANTTLQQACQQAYASGDYESMAKLHEQCTGGAGGTAGGMMGNGQNGMMGSGKNRMMSNGWTGGGMMGGW